MLESILAVAVFVAAVFVVAALLYAGSLINRRNK